jgi:hypothetical protein
VSVWVTACRRFGVSACATKPWRSRACRRIQRFFLAALTHVFKPSLGLRHASPKATICSQPSMLKKRKTLAPVLTAKAYFAISPKRPHALLRRRADTLPPSSTGDLAHPAKLFVSLIKQLIR